MSWSTLLYAMLPEHLLLAGIVLIVLLELGGGSARAALGVALAALGAAAGAAGYLWWHDYAATPFPGHLSVTPSLLLAQAAVLLLGIPVLLVALREELDHRGGILLLSSLYGLILLCAADSFLTLLLGLELLALPVYALVVLGPPRPYAAEAALKYLVLGGVGTALFLLGVALLAAPFGDFTLDAFTAALGSPDPLGRAGLGLVLAALMLKAALVPFHGWAPDAYAGASLPVTGYMAALVKAGVLVTVARLVGTTPLPSELLELMSVLALASIVWGNLAAMRQPDVRRVIAYSSIAHAGYLFFAFLDPGPGRFPAILFYLLAYGAANLLLFAALPPGPETERDRLTALDGLYQRRPWAASLLGLALLSLAGLPPLPGFTAKFYLFQQVVAAGHPWWAVAAFLGSFLGIYFYLRVVMHLFMNPPSEPEPAAAPTPPGEVWATLAGVLCLLTLLGLAIFPGWVIQVVVGS